MGLGSTGLDAQPHAGAISCQIEPQEMGTVEWTSVPTNEAKLKPPDNLSQSIHHSGARPEIVAGMVRR